MDDKPQVDYIATVDTSSVNPDGSVPEHGILLLEAIPVAAVERLASLFSETPDALTPEGLDFLLLQVPAPVLLSVTGGRPGWFGIQISEGGAPQLQGFEAVAPSFGVGDRRDLSLQIGLAPWEVPRQHLKLLKRIGNLDALPESTPAEIADILRIGNLAAIAVYDIGQGSLSALVDEHEHPMLFFDLGWPLPFNEWTQPPTPKFDPFVQFHYLPSVVLSHLDFDHWGYAIESGRAKWDPSRQYWLTQPIYRQQAMARPWLMRRPSVKRHKLGAWHLHFALTLAQSKLPNNRPALHIWPERRSKISVGPVTVFKCTNRSGRTAKPAYLRNNESLGLHVRKGPAQALLCGDADYPSIPQRYKRHLTGVVAPHHGGATTRGTMPDAIGHGRMVMSTHQSAYPSIPHPAVLSEARKLGWSIARTDDRFSCPRCQADHGHRMIRLGQTPHCGCNGVDGAQLCIAKP